MAQQKDFGELSKSEMYHMHEITDEISLRICNQMTIYDFYSKERPQDRYDCKTPSRGASRSVLSSDNPTEYPIPENKRINKYKEKWCA